MKPRVLCGFVAHSPLFLMMKNKVSGRDFHTSTHSVAVRFRSDQKSLQPVIRISAIVSKKLRPLPIVAHQNVQVAVVVEIPHCGAAAHGRQLKIRPELIAHILENAMPRVAKHQLRLGVVNIALYRWTLSSTCPHAMKRSSAPSLS